MIEPIQHVHAEDRSQYAKRFSELSANLKLVLSVIFDPNTELYVVDFNVVLADVDDAQFSSRNEEVETAKKETMCTATPPSLNHNITSKKN